MKKRNIKEPTIYFEKIHNRGLKIHVRNIIENNSPDVINVEKKLSWINKKSIEELKEIIRNTIRNPIKNLTRKGHGNIGFETMALMIKRGYNRSDMTEDIFTYRIDPINEKFSYITITANLPYKLSSKLE